MKKFRQNLMTCTMSNQRGFLSADFLFSIIIGITVCMMLFAMCFTFTAIEVAQYMAFSVARAYSAAHADQQKQDEMARKKFDELMNKKYIGNFFKGNWFELKNLQIKSGENNQQFTEYEFQTNRVPQTGVRLDFTAKVLNFRVSFLGSSSEDGNKAFTARVTGLIFREPTTSECRAQLKGESRNRAIINLDPRYSILDPAGGSNPKYVPIEDNGC